LAVLSSLDALVPVAARLQRHLDMVRGIAHVLGEKKPTRQVQDRLAGYLTRLRKQAPRRGRGTPTGRFVDHLLAVSRRYWPGLFHTYDDPRIPSTTSVLESFFGSTKRAARTTSGRKTTAGGKLESFGEAILRIQALAAVHPTELKAHLLDVPPEDFAASKRRLSKLKEPARRRRSFQRHPERYLDRALEEWLGD
jgi:hypothetical protein